MSLCSYCSKISVNNLVPYYPANWEQVPEIQVCFKHQPNYNALRNSAQNCELCALFYDLLETRNSAKPIPPGFTKHELSNIWLVSGNQAFSDLSMPKNISAVRVNVGTGTLMKEVDLRVTADWQDPLALAGDVTGRATLTEPGLGPDRTKIFRLIRDWLGKCQKDHACCMVSGTFSGTTKDTSDINSFPTRLIDVGTDRDPESLFLWETGHKSGQYAALSYSWGRSKSFKTQERNISQRLKGFNLSDLPDTIRDAVIITRELGLQYLWVDALCIIQDNKADWAVESARMDEVYGNAVITIAAASSEDKWDGCFRSSQSLPRSVAIKSMCSNGRDIGTMSISARVGSVYDVLERSPLCNRAWTLQERVLSRRSVHFAQDQIYWECQKLCIAEDGMVFDETLAINRCMPMIYDLATQEPSQDVLRRWHILVDEYSNRQFFAASDKLPALSGIARQVQKRLQDDYLAGIWRKDLPTALLWNTGGEKNSMRSIPPQIWRAPSWSWASVDGCLSLDMRTSALVYEELLDDITILEANVKVMNEENPYGEVIEAEMIVRGRLRQVVVTLQKQQFDYGGWMGNLDKGCDIDEYNEEGCSIGIFHYDCGNEKTRRFLALHIRSVRDSQMEFHFFIGVVKETYLDHYRRIGVGYLKGADQFKYSQVVTISLV